MHSSLKIKVCGMKNPSNIEALIKLKPDFIGYIFHEPSPRNVAVNPNVVFPKNTKKVGVFVDKPLEFILGKATEFSLDYIQLHGKETVELCMNLKQHSLKVIKAFNIFKEFDFTILKDYTTTCDYFLFDAFGKNAGGNGIVFNWDLLQNYVEETPFLLSGGIDSNTIEKIKQLQHPKCIGVDINSKFEIDSGLKNIRKIQKFKDELQS